MKTTAAYGSCAISLVADEGTVRRVREELEPFFLFDSSIDAGARNAVTLRVHPEPLAARPDGAGREVKVDTSLYPHLASTGRYWGNDQRWTVRIDANDSWFVFDRTAQTADMFQPDGKRALTDAVRFIKGIATTAVEKAGAIQVHCAAAVTASGETVLLLGDMWQGKTTLLLELLSKFNVRQLSCDTVVLRPVGTDGIEAIGWPSPFSMSHGTMSDHAQLHPYIPEERKRLDYETLWREGRKSVLTSKQIVELFDTTIEPRGANIALCLIARFKPNELTALARVANERELVEHLRAVYLGSRDPIYHNWTRYFIVENDEIEQNIRAMASRLLAGTSCWTMTWAPSAESLMKRLPILARSHKTLSSLFR